MNCPKLKRDDSAYVAFRDDRQRKWALVSRDIRLVLIAIAVVMGGEGASAMLHALFRFTT